MGSCCVCTHSPLFRLFPSWMDSKVITEICKSQPSSNGWDSVLHHIGTESVRFGCVESIILCKVNIWVVLGLFLDEGPKKNDQKYVSGGLYRYIDVTETFGNYISKPPPLTFATFWHICFDFPSGWFPVSYVVSPPSSRQVTDGR